MNNDNIYYHGTSTIYEIGEWLLPSSKAAPENIKTLYKRKNARVFVTNDLDAAKYYASKASTDKGGSPIIYVVEPDTHSMIRVSRTDFSTLKAKIIGEIKDENTKTEV